MTLGRDDVAAIDSTGQGAEICDLGTHLRDALWRVDSAGLTSFDAPGGLVVAGMGGSAVGGYLARGALYKRLRRPLLVSDGYNLPPWVGADTLVLCSSYSGTTAETLACYDDARDLGAPIVVATTGGALAERARRDRVPVVPLPGGFQPRAAVGYSLVAALEVAALAGVGPSLRDEVEAAAALADRLAAEWGPDGPPEGAAKALARRLHGTVPVVMGAGLTSPVAYRWKCQFNENAKLPAFSSLLPEADHNEICGWERGRKLAPFSGVFLEDADQHPRVQRRIELTAAEFERAGAPALRVAAPGDTRLDRVLSLVMLGDLVSVHLARLDGVDPTPVEALERFKGALAQP
jgi:glucose/mannose-6-phosphate isomerase